MKKANRLFVLFVPLSIIFIIQECFTSGLGLSGNAPASEISFISEARSYTGTVTGSFDARLLAFGQQPSDWSMVDCNDPAAVYKMTIAPDAKLPAGSRLTGGLTKGNRYFRLDVIAVVRMLDKGQCLDRDPSQDRTDLILEGEVNPQSGAFNLLSCDEYGAPQKADIGLAGPIVVGNIVCILNKPEAGQQPNSYTFSFSGLQLK